MDVIWLWITQNWQLVLTLGIGLLEFVLLLIFRGKRKICYNLKDNILNRCYEYLPDLINEAEAKFPGQGARKLQYVLVKVISKFNTIGDVVYDKNIINEVTAQIERILTTPTKKGD